MQDVRKKREEMENHREKGEKADPFGLRCSEDYIEFKLLFL